MLKIEELLSNELFKQLDLNCKFPKMKKLNLYIFSELIKLFPDLDRDDILFIFKNKNNLSLILQNTTCKCGKFKHTHLDYCSRQCNYFKQSVVHKMEQTNLKRRGVRNASFDAKVKEKISIKNKACSQQAKKVREQTSMIRYGVKNYATTQQCRDSIKKTCNKRYGKDSYSQTPEYHIKVKKKNNEKYGKDYYSQTQECKDRVAMTSLLKCGETNIFKTEEFKKNLRKHNLETYGKEYYTQTDDYKKKSKNTWKSKTKEEINAIKEKSKETRIKNGNQYPDNFVQQFLDNWIEERKPSPRDFLNFVHENYNKSADLTNIYTYISKEDFKFKQSLLENIVEKFLQDYNINYEKRNRKIISPQELDFYLPDYKVALEVNDIWSHNSTIGPLGCKPKPLNYHFNKTIQCMNKGVRLIHIFEPYIFNKNSWEIIKDIILHACGKSHKIYARNTDIEVKPANELNEFFNKNNISGTRGAKTAFVLVDKKTREPLMAYSVGKAWFGKGKYDAEITRGASKLGYSIIGGASKLWNYIINYYKDKNLDNKPGRINSIVYYVNLNYYNGSSMSFLKGNKFITNRSSFWNYWVDEKVLKNREPSRHREIKKLEQEGKVLVVGNAGTQVNVWTRQ